MLSLSSLSCWWTSQTQLVRQSTVTQTESLALMKNFLRASISSIVHQRGLLPEECFEDATIGELRVKRINSKASEDAQKLANWLEQGQFLEQLLLQIFVKGDAKKFEDMKMIESFSFGFQYGEDGPNMSLLSKRMARGARATGSKDHVIQFTKEMLTGVLDMVSSLPSLNKHGELVFALKILYFDEKTPRDYEPPFFRPAPLENDVSWFSEDILRLNGGLLVTPYHSCHVEVASSSQEDLTVLKENDKGAAKHQQSQASASKQTSGKRLTSRKRSTVDEPLTARKRLR
ncbi:HORMA domain-containing protein 1 [Porphyridium purpureum]|uniref:HORMA domain-containing protein 1 n=1 Tax=Porphyridium purpureum TaxID=35688 RepID=A0A5J4YVR6_PORPP|nr:HORMA domain-containing protein 1 [Porphyridium purpureum]|eukprot:POR6942..scf227_4